MSARSGCYYVRVPYSGSTSIQMKTGDLAFNLYRFNLFGFNSPQLAAGSFIFHSLRAMSQTKPQTHYRSGHQNENADHRER